MEEEKKKSKLKIAIIVLLVLILAVVTVYAINTIRYRQYYKESHKPTSMGIDPNQGEYVEQEKQKVDEGQRIKEPNITIPGWNELYFKANTTEINTVDLYNPDANKDWYYLTFELRLMLDDENYEVLYTSKLIEPGKHIQKITIDHALEPGEYKAKFFVQPYGMSDRTKRNSVILATTIIVK